MAQSKIGGIYGLLRGSVGAVTFSTKRDKKGGRRVQVVRQKAVEVSNPQSTAQIFQRMKIGPAQRFYNAWEGVALGGLLSHSWEGVEYGEASRQYFLQKVMSMSPAFIPKNADRFIPVNYPISEGSILSINADLVLDDTVEGATIDLVGDPLTAEQVAALNSIGVATGDQVTILAVTDINGMFTPIVSRFINRVGEAAPDTVIGEVNIKVLPATGEARGKFNIASDGSNVIAGAVILSRQDASGKWLRSTESLTIIPALANNLYSQSAMLAALASYRSNETLNSLNSEWYLNLASNQAFNGELQYLYLNTSAEDSVRLFVGVEQSGRDVYITVFKDQYGNIVVSQKGKTDPNITELALTTYNRNVRVTDWKQEYQIQYEGNFQEGVE